MPEAVVSGGIVIIGSRTQLPPGSSTLSPILPLEIQGEQIAESLKFLAHRTEQATILNNVELASSGSATLDVSSFRDMMLDMAFGAASGSIDVSIEGFVPIVNLPGSTLVDSGWYSGTTLSTQNMQATSPLGSYSVISWNVVGTIENVTIVADLET